MHISRGRAAATAVAVGAGLAATTGFGSVGASAHPAAQSSGSAVVVNATIKKHVIELSSGSIQAGRTYFNVSTTIKHGSHTLQLVHLHPGYTKAQFKSDVTAGVDQGNNTNAIRRLDHRVTWLGGTQVRRGQVRQFGAALKPGKYFALDQDGSAVSKLKVNGPKAARPGFQSTATVVGTDNMSWKAPKVLPAKGWIRLKNTSDEAHFLVLQRVAKSTHGSDIRKYLKSGGHSRPSWARKGSTSSGVFSHHTNVVFQTHLRKGKYLMACFWPSKETGAPHFVMGMWKLVHLR